MNLSIVVSNVKAIEALEAAEAQIYQQTMAKAKFNQSKAAKALGVSRGTLRTKLKQYFPGVYI